MATEEARKERASQLVERIGRAAMRACFNAWGIEAAGDDEYTTIKTAHLAKLVGELIRSHATVHALQDMMEDDVPQARITRKLLQYCTEFHLIWPPVAEMYTALNDASVGVRADAPSEPPSGPVHAQEHGPVIIPAAIDSLPKEAQEAIQNFILSAQEKKTTH